MREIKVVQSETKRRLLDAAEQLFAENGFDVVAVRDVTEAAGANVAAVNYYFGSRDGLLALVVTRHITPVIEERLARLDILEKKWPGKVVPLEEIIEAFVRPVVSAARKSEFSERLCCRLLGRIFSLEGKELPESVENQMRHSSDRFKQAFHKVIPMLGADDLAWRMHFVVGAMVHMLMNQEILDRLAENASGSLTMESAIRRFIRFAVAGLRDGAEVEIEEDILNGSQAVFDFA